MILKSKIISLVVVILLFVSGPVFSRSPWETTKQQTTDNNGIWKSSASDNQSVGPLRGGPNPPPDQPPGDEITPIGEGLLILSLLSGGYFMLKRRNSKE